VSDAEVLETAVDAPPPTVTWPIVVSDAAVNVVVRAMLEPETTATPSCCVAWKPAAEIVTLYTPGGTATLYEPSDLVVVSVELGPLMAMCTPPSGFPEPSVTLPVIVPVVAGAACATVVAGSARAGVDASAEAPAAKQNITAKKTARMTRTSQQSNESAAPRRPTFQMVNTEK
jgi:hypothetical protein